MYQLEPIFLYIFFNRKLLYIDCNTIIPCKRWVWKHEHKCVLFCFCLIKVWTRHIYNLHADGYSQNKKTVSYWYYRMLSLQTSIQKETKFLESTLPSLGNLIRHHKYQLTNYIITKWLLILIINSLWSKRINQYILCNQNK